jgi:Transposase DDE domain
VGNGNFNIIFDGERQWRGRPGEYSDAAIECCLVLRSLFHLPLRATQGFVEGMIRLLDLDIAASDYTLLCKRAGQLKIELKALAKDTPMDIVVDSTGLKFFGEGEWNVRTHGKSKRRSWRKLHLGVNANTHEIEGFALTDNNVHDGDEIDHILPNVSL